MQPWYSRLLAVAESPAAPVAEHQRPVPSRRSQESIDKASRSGSVKLWPFSELMTRQRKHPASQASILDEGELFEGQCRFKCSVVASHETANLKDRLKAEAQACRAEQLTCSDSSRLHVSCAEKQMLTLQLRSATSFLQGQGSFGKLQQKPL